MSSNFIKSLKKPLVYVARDIERALGMEPTGNYFIISNDNSYAREIKEKYPDNVILIKNSNILDTFDLLSTPECQDFISKHTADIVVFQNTSRIERLCAEKGWKLINPSAEQSKRIEEKISQVEWLGDDAKFLPPHNITLTKDAQFVGKKFVLQFNHAHTGKGTYVIESESSLEKIKNKFPNRECRITDYIDGPVFTVNVIVGKDIIVGNPSYQITGLSPFTDLPFSTIGNDWTLPQTIGYEKAYRDTKTIAEIVGKRLMQYGWKGLFGIDVVFDQKTKETYLLEINARQPASAVFESILQGEKTIFEGHIAALLGIDTAYDDRQISGAQIVKRITEKTYSMDINSLHSKGLTVIEYENKDLNQELWRIQSAAGIMESHDRLNDLGKFIQSCIK